MFVALALGSVLISSCVDKESDSDASSRKSPLVEPTPLEGGGSPAPAGPGEAVADTSNAAQTASEGSADCEQLHAEIRKFNDGFPEDLSSVKGSAADRLAEDTVRYSDRCRHFLASCRSADALKTAEVAYMLARFRFVLSARHRLQWVNELKEVLADAALRNAVQGRVAEYMGETERLAREASEGLPPEHPWKPLSLRLRGQALAEAQRHGEAAEAYRSYLQRYPEGEEVDAVMQALARVYLDMEEYDQGIEVVKEALKKHYTSDTYPFYGETLWKLYHSKGDVTGMLEYCKMVETVYPLKLSNTDLGPVRKYYEQFLDYNGFRRGYTLFALGEFGAARDAFSAHIEFLGRRAEDLGKANLELPPASGVYLQRSEVNLKVMDTLVGLPAPAELALADLWVTPRKVQVAESRGKVVGIVFRGVNDERSAAFVGEVSRFCLREPDMAFVTVSYLRGAASPAEQVDELREELGRLGFEGAAGFDPDAADKQIFRSYLANVGSATFVILNRRGEVAWYQQDPRNIDDVFAQEQLRRVANRS